MKRVWYYPNMQNLRTCMYTTHCTDPPSERYCQNANWQPSLYTSQEAENVLECAFGSVGVIMIVKRFEQLNELKKRYINPLIIIIKYDVCIFNN